MTRVLVTRPREDAAGLVTALAARGHEAVLEPLLTIVPREAVDWPAGHRQAQALVVSSANGVRAFARADSRRGLPVYAVGDASAAAARAFGFERIHSAGGDVHDLAALVREYVDPADGPLLHPAASKVAGDLRGDLARDGYQVLRVVLYDALPSETLSPESTRALDEGSVEVVTLFSPRTAAAFASLVTSAGLTQACAGITALCLSAAVAAEVRGIGWRSVIVARRPDQAALLEALDGLAAAS